MRAGLLITILILRGKSRSCLFSFLPFLLFLQKWRLIYDWFDGALLFLTLPVRPKFCLLKHPSSASSKPGNRNLKHRVVLLTTAK